MRAAPVERPEAVPAFGDGERPDDIPIRRPYVPEERPGDHVPVAVEPCTPEVVVRDGFQTKEVLRVRLDEVLVVVDGGGDEYPLAARGVRDGREGRVGIDEVPFDPQVPDAERVGRATDELGGLWVAGAAEALSRLVHVHARLIADLSEADERIFMALIVLHVRDTLGVTEPERFTVWKAPRHSRRSEFRALDDGREETFRLADDLLKLPVGVPEDDALPKFAQSLPYELEIVHQQGVRFPRPACVAEQDFREGAGQEQCLRERVWLPDYWEATAVHASSEKRPGETSTPVCLPSSASPSPSSRAMLSETRRI